MAEIEVIKYNSNNENSSKPWEIAVVVNKPGANILIQEAGRESARIALDSSGPGFGTEDARRRLARTRIHRRH